MVIGVIGHQVKGRVKFSAGVAVVCQKCDQDEGEQHLQDNQCVCVWTESFIQMETGWRREDSRKWFLR